jgi:hypothetical protein
LGGIDDRQNRVFRGVHLSIGEFFANRGEICIMKLVWNIALALLLAALSAVADSNPASATNMFDVGPVDTCGTPNCGARVIGGTVLLSSSFAVPWVAEIAVERTPNNDVCLRIDVTAQGTDLEAVLIAPDGRVFRNDNRAPGDLKPLIKVDAPPRSGWYTLQLSQAGGLPVNADFTLAFGRYKKPNANCVPATSSF